MLAIPVATTIRILPASNKADWVNVSQPNASLNHTALAEFFELRHSLLDLAGRLWFEGARPDSDSLQRKRWFHSCSIIRQPRRYDLHSPKVSCGCRSRFAISAQVNECYRDFSSTHRSMAGFRLESNADEPYCMSGRYCFLLTESYALWLRRSISHLAHGGIGGAGR